MRGRSGSTLVAGPSDRTSVSALAVRSPSIGSVAASVASTGSGAKRERQAAIRELVSSAGIGSQGELVDRLNERGFAVTQATVSRDIAELGLLKAPRDGRHVYVLAETLGGSPGTGSGAAGRTDERLRRILADIPVTMGRSGLILLVTGSPGTASIIAQAIDESSLTEQEGTLAGDNTLLVLFADEARLAAWRERFDSIRSSAVSGPLGGPSNS